MLAASIDIPLFQKNIQDSMKIFRALTFFILITTVSFTACSTSKNDLDSQVKGYSPMDRELYDSIAYLDSIFFNAFNTKDLDKVKAFLSDDLEFYHDLGGVTNYTQNIDAYKGAFESERKLRTEIIRRTLEVYPIKDYGAVETGIHRFYATEKGQQEKLSSEAKFVQVWQKKNGGWKITRIISYGHQEFLK
jgi:ketosteroid isomerase-like protein